MSAADVDAAALSQRHVHILTMLSQVRSHNRNLTRQVAVLTKKIAALEAGASPSPSTTQFSSSLSPASSPASTPTLSDDESRRLIAALRSRCVQSHGSVKSLFEMIQEVISVLERFGPVLDFVNAPYMDSNWAWGKLASNSSEHLAWFMRMSLGSRCSWWEQHLWNPYLAASFLPTRATSFNRDRDPPHLISDPEAIGRVWRKRMDDYLAVLYTKACFKHNRKHKAIHRVTAHRHVAQPILCRSLREAGVCDGDLMNLNEHTLFALPYVIAMAKPETTREFVDEHTRRMLSASQDLASAARLEELGLFMTFTFAETSSPTVQRVLHELRDCALRQGVSVWRARARARGDESADDVQELERRGIMLCSVALAESPGDMVQYFMTFRLTVPCVRCVPVVMIFGTPASADEASERGEEAGSEDGGGEEEEVLMDAEERCCDACAPPDACAEGEEVFVSLSDACARLVDQGVEQASRLKLRRAMHSTSFLKHSWCRSMLSVARIQKLLEKYKFDKGVRVDPLDVFDTLSDGHKVRSGMSLPPGPVKITESLFRKKAPSITKKVPSAKGGSDDEERKVACWLWSPDTTDSGCDTCDVALRDDYVRCTSAQLSIGTALCDGGVLLCGEGDDDSGVRYACGWQRWPFEVFEQAMLHARAGRAMSDADLRRAAGEITVRLTFCAPDMMDAHRAVQSTRRFNLQGRAEHRWVFESQDYAVGKVVIVNAEGPLVSGASAEGGLATLRETLKFGITFRNVVLRTLSIMAGFKSTSAGSKCFGDQTQSWFRQVWNSHPVVFSTLVSIVMTAVLDQALVEEHGLP